MTPEAILSAMLDNDPFSQWLGVSCTHIGPGACTLEATVRPEMTNGFGVAHGGITYSLADSALAFASNSHGQHAVSVETSIAHTAPVRAGDRLEAIATEDQRSKQFARYTVRVTANGAQLVALFHGTVYRKETLWEGPAW
jgi:acyl-CoA thioesterase